MRNVGKWTAVVVTAVVALVVGLALGAAAGTEKTVTAAVPTATETVTVTETQGSAEPVTETVEHDAPPVAAAGKKAPPPVTRARKVSSMAGSKVALVYVAAHAKGAATREIITVYRGSQVVARVATQRLRKATRKGTVRHVALAPGKWATSAGNLRWCVVAVTKAGVRSKESCRVLTLKARPTPPRPLVAAPAPEPKPDPIPAPEPEPAPANCHPSYSGACLDPSSSDYDCAGGSGNGPDYTGQVAVVGEDVFGLDRDGDGVGCD